MTTNEDAGAALDATHTTGASPSTPDKASLFATSTTNAIRCQVIANNEMSGIVGVTVAARNSADDLVVLESGSDSYDDGTVKCSRSVTPRELKRCAADLQPGFEQNCFTLDGLTLTTYGDTALDTVSLIKLSD